jgi:hypothetical protein
MLKSTIPYGSYNCSTSILLMLCKVHYEISYRLPFQTLYPLSKYINYMYEGVPSDSGHLRLSFTPNYVVFDTNSILILFIFPSGLKMIRRKSMSFKFCRRYWNIPRLFYIRLFLSHNLHLSSNTLEIIKLIVCL